VAKGLGRVGRLNGRLLAHTRQTESVVSKAYRPARTEHVGLATHIHVSGARTGTWCLRATYLGSWTGFCVYLEPCRPQITKET